MLLINKVLKFFTYKQIFRPLLILAILFRYWWGSDLITKHKTKMILPNETN